MELPRPSPPAAGTQWHSGGGRGAADGRGRYHMRYRERCRVFPELDGSGSQLAHPVLLLQPQQLLLHALLLHPVVQPLVLPQRQAGLSRRQRGRRYQISELALGGRTAGQLASVIGGKLAAGQGTRVQVVQVVLLLGDPSPFVRRRPLVRGRARGRVEPVGALAGRVPPLPPSPDARGRKHSRRPVLTPFLVLDVAVERTSGASSQTPTNPNTQRSTTNATYDRR